MRMKRVLSLLLVMILAAGTPICAVAEGYDHTPPAPTMTGFAAAEDGVMIEYAVYGDPNAEPLVLLSPNNGSMHAFDGDILPELAKRFMVVTFSTRGTGNTALGGQRLTFELDCADLLAVLGELGVTSMNVYGFSDGGNLGLVFTLAHPEMVRRLAVKGANINTRGTKLSSQIGIVWRYIRLSVEYFFTRDPQTLRRRNITGKMVGQPTLTFDDLSAISCPVLNIYGEHDMFYRSHSQGITGAIDGAQELMIEGSGHSATLEETDGVLLPALLEFFGDGA